MFGDSLDLERYFRDWKTNITHWFTMPGTDVEFMTWPLIPGIWHVEHTPASKPAPPPVPCTVEFTEAAKVVAMASGLAAVERLARLELTAHGIGAIRNLWFHTIKLPNGRQFVCYPVDATTLEINANSPVVVRRKRKTLRREP
jgi:hypothetical protein